MEPRHEVPRVELERINVYRSLQLGDKGALQLDSIFEPLPRYLMRMRRFNKKLRWGSAEVGLRARHGARAGVEGVIKG